MLGRDQVALVYVDRTAAPKIKLRTSADGGRTWPPETELVVNDSAHASQSGTKQGMNDAWSILVVYYAGPHFDRTGVEWCRVR